MSRVVWTVLFAAIAVAVLIALLIWLNTPAGFEVIGEPDSGLQPPV